MIVLRNALLALGVFTLGLSLTGCGSDAGPKLADVKGKVTFKGKAVPGGMVVFLAPDGKQRGVGPISADGSFSLKSPIGKVQAAVVTRPAPENPGADRPAVRDVVMPPGINPASLPPTKYESFGTSGLNYEVKDGSNTIDIPLD